MIYTWYIILYLVQLYVVPEHKLYQSTFFCWDKLVEFSVGHFFAAATGTTFSLLSRVFVHQGA